MTTVLAYTSPARGHLEPMLDALAALHARGHRVAVRTLASAVPDVRAAGLEAEAVAPAIEALALEDHATRGGPAGARANGAVWARRAVHEPADLRAAVAAVRPDLVLVDTTAFGARAAAEADGLLWAESVPFLPDVPAPGLPPLGLGLRPLPGPAGRVRDAVARRLVAPVLRDLLLAPANAGRAAVGLPPLPDVAATGFRAPLTLVRTAAPFAWPRPLPPTARLVGPATWSAPGAPPPLPPDDGRPLVLVTGSSEFQDDGAIARTALDALAADHRLVVTTAGVDPATLPARGEAVVARFVPHGPVLARADCVVCHGGMGITQKALAAGVPVCVVPWGRDQLDVAAHVVHAGAGTRVSRRRLTPERLAAAVREARARRDGARRVAAGFAAAGGGEAAAGALEELLGRAGAGRPAQPAAAAT